MRTGDAILVAFQRKARSVERRHSVSGRRGLNPPCWAVNQMQAVCKTLGAKASSEDPHPSHWRGGTQSPSHPVTQCRTTQGSDGYWRKLSNCSSCLRQLPRRLLVRGLAPDPTVAVWDARFCELRLGHSHGHSTNRNPEPPSHQHARALPGQEGQGTHVCSSLGPSDPRVEQRVRARGGLAFLSQGIGQPRRPPQSLFLRLLSYAPTPATC